MHVHVVCMCVYLSSRYILIYISLISDLEHPFTYFVVICVYLFIYIYNLYSNPLPIFESVCIY